jgi:hypothetical protein
MQFIDGAALRRVLEDLVYPVEPMCNVRVENTIHDIIESVEQACEQSYELGTQDCSHTWEGEGEGNPSNWTASEEFDDLHVES